MAQKKKPSDVELRERAETLRLYGLLAEWSKLGQAAWVLPLIEAEESERTRRSQEYRERNAKIGAFKDRIDFNWKHPRKIDRQQIDELFSLEFLQEGQNVVFVGGNGVGKTMFARNLAHAAVSQGHTTRYISAADMLTDLAAHNGAGLRTRLKRYVSPKLLVIDELGYFSYDNHHADLLYEVVSRRYELELPIVLTTNRAFKEWNEVFEGAAVLTTLIDRICHRVEVVQIDADSYRQVEGQKEARARQANRRKKAVKK